MPASFQIKINLFAALHPLYSFTSYMFIPRKLQDATGHKPLTWHLILAC